MAMEFVASANVVSRCSSNRAATADFSTAQTKAAAKAADDYVRANPWQAVGISAAVGFMFGMLITRR